MLVNVKYGRQQNQLPVYVVKGNGPSLLGRNWLQKITIWLLYQTIRLQGHLEIIGTEGRSYT